MTRILILTLSLQAFAWTDGNVYDYASSIGIAVFSKAGLCLTINNHRLVHGDRVNLVVPSIPQSLVKAEVVGSARDACSASQLSDSGSNFYDLRLLSGTLPLTMPVIAVTNSSYPLQKTGAVISGDLAGDGQREFFRSCNSAEGIHLSVWSGKPLKGKRIWHGYYYLGYDLQPNCTPKDTVDVTSH
jgi:hypothetical protein